MLDLDVAINSNGSNKLDSIESYLKTVNYLVPRTYRPSKFAINFVNFIKLVNGEDGEENATPLMHLYMLDNLAKGDRRVANLCFRGSGKTTVMAEYLIFYLAVYRELPNFGPVDLILYVSDSIENGVKNLRKNLEYRWENSDFLQKYLPNIRFTDVRYEFNNIDGEKFVCKGYGASTGVRGAKEMGKRPQLAILDDLLSDEDARSATVINSIEETVYKAVQYALHPKQNMIIWSGTPFNAKDPLYKAVESGVWTVNVYPVCEQFPCSESEFVSAWPDRFNYKYVNQMYFDALGQGKIDTFNQELMLRIMSDEDRLIPDECILWYKRDILLQNRSNYNFYITTDFATSDKRTADFTVISVWAYSHNGDWFWVDGICERQTMDKNINDLFMFVQMYSPQSVGIEISGQQKGFVSWIQQEMMQRSILFNLAKEPGSNVVGLRPTTNKMKRFDSIVPTIKANKMFWPVEKKDSFAVQEAMNELKLVSKGGAKSKHDDFLDNISMLVNMSPWKPSMEQEFIIQNGIWEDSTHTNTIDTMSNYIV